jgi:three-Cys-motif partner protein
MPNEADPSKWDYPPHTRAKHDILGRYLDGWYPTLSKWYGRVVYFDGFAGRGRYNDGSEGSPLIALRRLLDHRFFPQMQGREFVFFFVEANADNATSLQEALDDFKASRQPWPPNVKYHVVNERFDVHATALIDYLHEQKRALAPTFAFVDPFGYSGLPMDLLADLLAYPRTELFVNFMVGHVQRFIMRDGQENAMRSLFGMDVRDVLASYVPGDADRVDYLHDVYKQQLHDRVGFPYVQSFGMINRTGNTGYYLFHGTRHPKGVSLMKEAMWKIDPEGDYTFSDRLAGHDVLFTLDPDLNPLREAFEKHFMGRYGVHVAEIEQYTLLETPYRETHVRPVLRKLELDRTINVNRPPGKRQFTQGVTIDFS